MITPALRQSRSDNFPASPLVHPFLLTLLLGALILLFSALPVHAQGDYVFDASTGTLAVLTDAGTSSWRSTVAPSQVQHLIVAGTVQNISADAFRGTAVTDVNIQEGVIYTGKYAFKDCTNLTYIAMPVTMSWVNSDAFTGCTALSSITFSSSMAAPSWLYNILERGTAAAARGYVLYVPTSAMHDFNSSAALLMKSEQHLALAVLPVTSSPYYGATALTDYDLDPAGYMNFAASVVSKIQSAGSGDTVSVETTSYYSFPNSVFNVLALRNDVNLKVTYTQNGQTHTFVIPKGYRAANLLDSTGYVSFSLLAGKF